MARNKLVPELSPVAWKLLGTIERFPGLFKKDLPTRAEVSGHEAAKVLDNSELAVYVNTKGSGPNTEYHIAQEGTDALQAYRTYADPAYLANVLSSIKDGLQRIEHAGINRKAVVALIHDDTKIAKGTIEGVLDSLAGLSKKYCRQA